MKARRAVLSALIVTMIAVTMLGVGRAASQRRGQVTPQVTPISVPCPSCIFFGATGIARGQTLRINVANLDPHGGPDQPPPGPVVVEFMFHDSQGNVVADSVQSVEGGHAASFDLRSADLPFRETNRLEYQPCVRVLTPPESATNTPVIISTVEVFDNIGPDAGKTRMGWTTNHNETLVRDVAVSRRRR